MEDKAILLLILLVISTLNMISIANVTSPSARASPSAGGCPKLSSGGCSWSQLTKRCTALGFDVGCSGKTKECTTGCPGPGKSSSCYDVCASFKCWGGGNLSCFCDKDWTCSCERPVGGIIVPVDKFGLLAPYIGLASTILGATVATAIYVKRVKRRKEKQ